MSIQKLLPEDIIADILSRIPVKSLLRFRCVCKPWCALISDPLFVKMHLSQSLANNRNLGLIFRSDCYLSSVGLDACEQLAAVRLDHPPHYGIKVVGSCNGLLCISNPDEDIFLWNPSTRRHQKLHITPIAKGFLFDRFIVYGFGYDPSTNDYKLVRVVLFFGFDCEVNVYSLRTNSWRRIGYMPFNFFIRHEFRYGVLANSFIHWVASRKTGADHFSCFILSFDLQDEEYGELPLPEISNKFHMNTRELPMNIGVLGGQLCVLCNFFNVRVEVWVMKDYNVKYSWMKQFTINLPSMKSYLPYIKPLCYSKNSEVILEKVEGVLVMYDPHTGRARDLMIRGAQDRLETVIYVESLVPLNAKDGTEQAKKEEEHEAIKGN